MSKEDWIKKIAEEITFIELGIIPGTREPFARMDSKKLAQAIRVEMVRRLPEKLQSHEEDCICEICLQEIGYNQAIDDMRKALE